MTDFYYLVTPTTMSSHRDTEQQARQRAQQKANRDGVTVMVLDSEGKTVAVFAPQAARKG